MAVGLVCCIDAHVGLTVRVSRCAQCYMPPNRSMGVAGRNVLTDGKLSEDFVKTFTALSR